MGWKLTKQSRNNLPLLERTKCVLGDGRAEEQDDRSEWGGSDDNNYNDGGGGGNDRYPIFNRLDVEAVNNLPLLERTKCVLGERSAEEQDDSERGGFGHNNNDHILLPFIDKQVATIQYYLAVYRRRSNFCFVKK